MWWQRGWPALLAIWIIVLLHRLTNGEISGSGNGNGVQVYGDRSEFGSASSGIQKNRRIKDFEKVRGGIDRGKYAGKSTRHPSYAKSLNIDRDEDGIPISSNLGLRVSNVGKGKSIKTDNEKGFRLIREWRQKLENKSSRMKRSRMLVNNVENRSLGYSQAEMQEKNIITNKVDGKQSGSFVKGYSASSAKAKHSADGQPTTKSFNDSKAKRSWTGNVKSDLYGKVEDPGKMATIDPSVSRKNSTALISGKKIKYGFDSGTDETSKCIGKTKFNKEPPIGLSVVNYAEYIEAEPPDSNVERNSFTEYRPAGESYRRTNVAGDMRPAGDPAVGVANELLGYSESGLNVAEIPEIPVRGKIGVTDGTEIALSSVILGEKTSYQPPTLIHSRTREIRGVSKIDDQSFGKSGEVGDWSLEKNPVIGAGNENDTVSEGNSIYGERKAIEEVTNGEQTKTTLNITAQGARKNSSVDEQEKSNGRGDIELGNSSAYSNALGELNEGGNLPDENKPGDSSPGIEIPKLLGHRSDADIEITRSSTFQSGNDKHEDRFFVGNSTPVEFAEDEGNEDAARNATRVSGEKIVQVEMNGGNNRDSTKFDTKKIVGERDINSTLLQAPRNAVGKGFSLTVNLFDRDEKNETGETSKTNLLDKLWWDSKPKVVNLSALDISGGGVGGGEYGKGFKTERDFEEERKNSDENKLSVKISVVGGKQTPVKLNSRRKFPVGYPNAYNNAEARAGKFLIAKIGDKYLRKKNKRDEKSSGVKMNSMTDEANITEKVSPTVSFIPDLVYEDSKAQNLSWQKIFTLVNKSETTTTTRTTATFGSILAASETWKNNTRLFLRSFSGPAKEEEEEVEEEGKEKGKETEKAEQVTTSESSGQSEQLFDEKGDFISGKGDLSRLDNSTEMNIFIGNKNGTIDQSYSNYGNDSTTIKNILKALEPLNSDLIDHDRLSTLVENLISTETPLITTLDIFEAINQSLNPQIASNQTDSDNTSRVLTESTPQWPVKHSAVVEGDLVLGGLMMVHEREDTVICGPVMPQGGVQALEAMLFTLDRLNQEPSLIPGVKIGAHILDDCDKDTYGLEMAVDFIKGSISNIDGAEYHCNKTAVRKVISGVVGAASSVTSIQVANLLRLFRIPQVSFFSTSPELSNKQRFEYFTRTIPSDHYQVKAMVDIVRKLNWSYVSIIYEESNYGIKAFEELEELLAKYDICIAIKEKLVKDSGVAEETAYDNIVQKLLTKPRARGCIIFGSDQEVAGVMRAVRRCNATGSFSWIGSDGWSARGLVSDGNEPEVEGTLSVQPQANPVKGFEEYFLDLTVENNRRNPWFVEFWEAHFQCRYPNASSTPYNEKYTEPCTTKERLTKQNTAFEDQLQFVSDAVTAFGYAFRDMHQDLCNGKPGLCDAMKPTKGTELLKYLRKVHFEGLSGDKFRFDKNGDGPARYNIIHFKQVSPGQYKWLRVGEYMEGELRLNMSEIQFRAGQPSHPESVCSLPCEVGQAKKYVEGESCCWHCFNCTQYQVRHPRDETQCILCPLGTLPDETRSNCSDIPEEFLRPESGWAIGAMSFSATGILVTLFVGGVFLRHNDTPVVKAAGRELSYVLLTGILLCYLVTFALVLRPNNIVCGIQRFGAGFCFTVVYAALLTKTNRISRIFNAGKRSAKRPSFISQKSQLIICFGLVGVQILINGVWMIIDPAKAMHHYPTKEDNLLVCSSYIDASYMIAFSYPIILIVVCTVYAVLTRKIPEAFNESKHIGFTMYTTCVIWLAFVPLYFGTGNHVALRITSMSVTISLSASVTIACLFSPKLYIILIRPERNVRQPMINTAKYNTGTKVTGTSASSMMAAVTLTAVTCDQNKAVKRHVITTIDCSTQSEHYEMELKEDRINGKPPISLTTCATQTQHVESDANSGSGGRGSAAANTNAKETIKDCTTNSQGGKKLNNLRIGNGPMSHKDTGL